MGKNFCYEDLRLKDLKALARGLQVRGWHEMVKSELVPLLRELDPAGRCVNPKKGGGKQPAQSGKVKTKKGAVSAKETTVKAAAKRSTKSDTAKIESKTSPKSEKKTEKLRKTNRVSAGGSKASEKKTARLAKSAVKAVSEKKSSPPPKPVVIPPRKVTAPPKDRSKIVRSRLNVRPPAVDLVSETADDDKKMKRRRAVQAKREDVTRIPNRDDLPAPKVDETPKEPSKSDSLKIRLIRRKTLETPASGSGNGDRIVLQVCGPFWLHAWWEISANIVSRIRAAMGHLWHTADPVLRLYRVRYDAVGGRHTEFVSDFLIHGGIYNWFLNVENPPDTFQVEIGYRSRDNQFFSLASSNTVETPQNYIQESMGWSESSWNMLMASTMTSPFTTSDPDSEDGNAPVPKGEPVNLRRDGVDLSVDAEVVIKGKTSPDVRLTIRGERIWVREDGTFLVRYHLPERRHVFPVAAVSRDGIDTKTIVLSVERNTKNLETVVRSQNEDD